MNYKTISQTIATKHQQAIAKQTGVIMTIEQAQKQVNLMTVVKLAKLGYL